MTKNRFLWRALATLVFIVLLIAAGAAVYYAGWSQGYAAGQLGEESATLPLMPHGLGYPGRPFGLAPFAFGVGLIFKIGLFLLVLVLIGSFLRLLAWKAIGGPWMATMGGPMSRHWASHWRRAHRHVPHWPPPPWWGDWEEAFGDEGQDREAGPGAEPSAAEM
jgi:hypothetical protein